MLRVVSSSLVAAFALALTGCAAPTVSERAPHLPESPAPSVGDGALKRAPTTEALLFRVDDPLMATLPARTRFAVGSAPSSGSSTVRGKGSAILLPFYLVGALATVGAALK